jgi:ribosomal protein S27E
LSETKPKDIIEAKSGDCRAVIANCFDCGHFKPVFNEETRKIECSCDKNWHLRPPEAESENKEVA